MAYKTESLAKVLSEIGVAMTRLDVFAGGARSRMQAGDVSADLVLDTRDRLNKAKATFNALSSTPGLADYAKDQNNDPAYDVAAEFVSVIAAIDAVVANIESTFPADGAGYLLERKFDGTGIEIRTFTPAQTSSLQALLATLEASIV